MSAKTLDVSQSIGDPFVENGRLGLIAFIDKFFPENTQKNYDLIVEKLIDLYIKTDKNRGKLSSIFDHHPVYFKTTPEAARKKCLKIFDSAVKNIDESSYCQTCAKKGTISFDLQKGPSQGLQRVVFPLGYSDTNINFLSGFKKQSICLECFVSLFALPLNVQKAAGVLVFMNGENSIKKYWGKLNINERLRMISANESNPIIDSTAKTYEGFMFLHLTEIAEENIEVNNDVSFVFFSNYCDSPDIYIKTIPNASIKFLEFSVERFEKESRMITQIKEIWRSLIRKNYHSKSIQFEDGKLVEYEVKTRQKKGKKTTEWIRVGEATDKRGYQIGRNWLIDYFIKGESILRIILKGLLIDIKTIQDKQTALELSMLYRMLTFKYLQEVRQMEKSRLDFIKEFAKKLSTLNNAKSILREISLAYTSSKLRVICIRAMKEYFDKSNEKLFSVDDFVYKLFPTGIDIRETRDIIIVAMYEHLADQLIQDEELSLETISNLEDEDE